MSTLLKTVIGGVVPGLVFGIAFEKSKILEPFVIKNQLNFSLFIMFKMFLAAVSTSTLSLLLLEKMGIKKRQCKPAQTMLGVWYGDVMIGGLVLGMGMALSGSCPGTVWAQLGSLRVGDAAYTFAGAAFGAILYGLVQPTLKKVLRIESHPVDDTVDSYFGVSYHKIAIVASSLMIMGVVALEKLFPWTEDLQAIGYTVTNTNILDLTAPHWHPAIAGALIGFTQIASGYLANAHLGMSTSYCSFVGQGLQSTGVTSSKYEYFLKYAGGTFQKVLVISTFLGALLSAQSSGLGTSQATSIGSPLQHFIGGVLLLFGARFSNGCPSGHGITGMSQMNIPSTIAVIFMFGGGILTSLLA